MAMFIVILIHTNHYNSIYILFYLYLILIFIKHKIVFQRENFDNN